MADIDDLKEAAEQARIQIKGVAAETERRLRDLGTALEPNTERERRRWYISLGLSGLAILIACVALFAG